MQLYRRFVVSLKSEFRETSRREYIANLLFLCGIGLAIFISAPVVLGAFGIIWGDKEIPSASASIQLAFVSTALGAVVLWFVTHLNTRLSRKSSKEAKSNKRFRFSQRRSALIVGTMFLFAAMCFTLFALLCPLFPEAKDSEVILFVIVKWTSVLSLMAGSMALCFSLCLGIFGIWAWSLTND